MTLRFENKKEFRGFSRETVLVFSDDCLSEELIPALEEFLLKNYDGSSGEVVDFKIINDYKNRRVVLIFVIIVCFKTLVEDVSDYKYQKFIEKHKNDFMKFYGEIFSFG